MRDDKVPPAKVVVQIRLWGQIQRILNNLSVFRLKRDYSPRGGGIHLPEAPCHSLHVLFLLDHEDDSLTVSSLRRIRSQTTWNSTQSFCFLANSTHRLDTETQLSKGGIHPRTTN